MKPGKSLKDCFELHDVEGFPMVAVVARGKIKPYGGGAGRHDQKNIAIR